MATPTSYDLAQKWLQQDADPETISEIQNLLEDHDTAALESRLRSRIAFGTAGLRSSMKAGFAHMNSLTVLQASQGIATYVLSQHTSPLAESRSIVVGYDGRHNSEKFARLAAAAFLAKGLGVLWLGLVHTPMVPFAITHFSAAAGVMVTASHNPKQDNGYKVYWANGCQIIPPRDKDIARAIELQDTILSWDLSAIDNNSAVRNVFGEARTAYIAAIETLVPSSRPSELLPFTYTPMHGVGLPFMQEAVRRISPTANSAMQVVSAQAHPDPEFPTVPFPNPEEKGALDLAIKAAEQSGSRLIIANDPDADRFAAAEQLEDGTWHQFTGNEMGALLAAFIYETSTVDKSKLAMLASTVSSRMLKSLAKKEGFTFRETLTGFKYLGNVAQELRQEGFEPVFAYEEAIGYMFPTVAWDKDGIAAAVVFLIARQQWQGERISPWRKLQGLYERYGHFADANTYLTSPSPEVTEQTFAAIRTLNNGSVPSHLARREIRRWRDLTMGYDSGTADGRPELPIDAAAQMITCWLDDALFTARGSGTEPKIKLYVEAIGAKSSAEAKAVAREVLDDLVRAWFPGLKLAGS
ncbi:hypothetical protein LTR62_000864 [Meristemomyces frigidus]|uniref:Phosphoglucomutase n=1 Tax=Meristemomyces frigidus TaxID=1508187 RepID=A0AAN7TGU6_9PEZI|nr:hypothetical protein LTR62_000864 [Meristemomyces frigidus]